ncbi:hypothetical protein [Streptomyces sp. NPDC058086]|uniref:hypothetical protein n=1 Tax=Streptomyces sp. NPDC058086 TaxID=3346334 RepID=UPI0036EDEB72
MKLSEAMLSTSDRWALFAGGLVMEGGVFCRRGFTAHGGIRLLGAQLSGGLFMEGARLDNPDGPARVADNAVASTLVFSKGFTAQGAVCLRGAQISDQLTFDGAILNGEDVALDCSRMQAGDVHFTPAAPPSGAVDLLRAQGTTLHDGEGIRPRIVRLQGFSYASIQSKDGLIGLQGVIHEIHSIFQAAARGSGVCDGCRVIAVAGYRVRGTCCRGADVCLSRQAHLHRAAGRQSDPHRGSGRRWGEGGGGGNNGDSLSGGGGGNSAVVSCLIPVKSGSTISLTVGSSGSGGKGGSGLRKGGAWGRNGSNTTVGIGGTLASAEQGWEAAGGDASRCIESGRPSRRGGGGGAAASRCAGTDRTITPGNGGERGCEGFRNNPGLGGYGGTPAQYPETCPGSGMGGHGGRGAGNLGAANPGRQAPSVPGAAGNDGCVVLTYTTDVSSS